MVLWPGSSLFPWGDPPCSLGSGPAASNPVNPFLQRPICIGSSTESAPSCPIHPFHPSPLCSLCHRRLHQQEGRRRDAEGEPAILHHHQQLQPLAIPASGLQRRICCCDCCLSRGLCCFALFSSSPQHAAASVLWAAPAFFFLRRRGHRGLILFSLSFCPQSHSRT